MKSNAKKIDGILLLDKPLHMTSNGVLQRVKWLFGAKKAGHTGSLDPLATGMLPLCFGEATKVSQFLLDSDKCYQVEVTLGAKTATGDAEGDIIETKAIPELSETLLKTVLQQFIGCIEQVPPMYSALKFQGKPLYQLARKGIEVERKARTVKIYSMTLNEWQHDKLNLTVQCSKGTYIRTLAEQIGEKLGCGGFVSALRRIAVMPYQQNKMHTLAEIEELHQRLGADALQTLLLPMDTSVQHLPPVKLSSSATFYLRTGQPVMIAHLSTEGFVRLFADDGRFMGIGEILEDGKLAPRRLVSIN